jgi:hypothetical protein
MAVLSRYVLRPETIAGAPQTLYYGIATTVSHTAALEMTQQQMLLCHRRAARVRHTDRCGGMVA